MWRRIWNSFPPVLKQSDNKDKSKSTAFVLNTLDNARFENTKETVPYSNSVQIIDADMPWPPRWFDMMPPYTDEEFTADTSRHTVRFNFDMDFKMDGGLLSFYKIMSHLSKDDPESRSIDMGGYIFLNKQMQAKDTVKSTFDKSNQYFHDMKTNARGEKLLDITTMQRLDMRKYTNNPSDGSALVDLDVIEILDNHDKVVFSWNLLDHFKQDLLKKILSKRKVLPMI